MQRAPGFGVWDHETRRRRRAAESGQTETTGGFMRAVRRSPSELFPYFSRKISTEWKHFTKIFSVSVFYCVTACNATHGIAVATLSVCLSDACIVTKRNNRLLISHHHTKQGYL